MTLNKDKTVKGKKKIISWNKFARMASVDPEKYKKDTSELISKFNTYHLLYGDLGVFGFLEAWDNYIEKTK
jgi:hypothetical protein